MRKHFMFKTCWRGLCHLKGEKVVAVYANLTLIIELFYFFPGDH